MLIFELFKVESGLIREILAFMTNEEYGKLSPSPAHQTRVRRLHSFTPPAQAPVAHSSP